MSRRVVLVHWHREEAQALAEELGRAGFAVEPAHNVAVLDFKGLRQDPPLAVLISLRRLPSHGREVAQALAETRWGRAIPVVFFDGEGGVVEVTRRRFPAARFARFQELPALLRELGAA